ncbi:MAG: NlpC/P60 family protein [Ilumatobacteraceae bacterium]
MIRLRPRAAGLALVACALTVSVVLSPASANAQTVDEQKARVQQITDQLEALEERSDILAEDYVTAVDEKNRLDAEVAAAEQRVAAKAAEVDALRGQLSTVAVQTYMGVGTNGFGPLFTDSSAVTDDLQRDQLSRVALSAGTASTDELDQAVSDLNDERAILDSTRDAAAAKAEQVDQAKKATDEKKAEYTTARADAEAKLGELIKEEEERRARESYERMQAAARQAQADAEAAARAAAQAQQRTAASASSSGRSNTSSNATASSGGGSSVAAVAAPAAAVSIPQASSRAGTAINAAMSQLGTAYRFAAAEPGVAFDCSGLTSWAWGQAGVGLPHQSRAQFASLPHVPIEAAQPGDLLFFYSPISHVSIYLGGGQQVHAPNSGTTVKVAPVNWGKVVGVGRPG